MINPDRVRVQYDLFLLRDISRADHATRQTHNEVQSSFTRRRIVTANTVGVQFIPTVCKTKPGKCMRIVSYWQGKVR